MLFSGAYIYLYSFQWPYLSSLYSLQTESDGHKSDQLPSTVLVHLYQLPTSIQVIHVARWSTDVNHWIQTMY
jgi:hypothetical protein